MNGVNLQILIGNLGRSAEIRSIDGSRSKASFSIATNKNYRNREGQNITNTYWHNIVIWDPRLIQVAEKYCTTGKQVLVEGESTSRSYQDRNGQTQYVREIKATNIIPIEHITIEQGDFGTVSKGFVLGRIAEKPVVSMDEMSGEPTCQLVFRTAEGTFPVTLTGNKADIAARYLGENSLAHVSYHIVSVSPFKAIGIDLTLLGQRPAAEGSMMDNNTSAQSSHNTAPTANVIPSTEPNNSSSEIDDLPF